MQRRVALALTLFAAVAVAAQAPPAFAQGKPPAPKAAGQVVVLTKGGSFQDAQREAYFKPFEQETGIKVVEATGVELAKIQAMVQSGNVDVDLIDSDAGLTYRLKKANLLEPIDYGKLDPGDVAAVDKRAIDTHAVPLIYFSSVINYNTKKFPAKHPTTWKEFWDVKTFPGTRVLPTPEKGFIPALEMALLADGVPMDKLYPLDIDRAWKKHSELRGNVIFVGTAAELTQAMATGEAVMGYNFNGRVQALMSQGAPVAIEWNQGRITVDGFVIPKGAKNRENAHKLLAFALRAKVQADFAKRIAYGPSNTKAYALLDEKTAKSLPGHPEHAKKQFMYDGQWWGENLDAVLRKFNEWKMTQ